ncbi:MAG TPA: amidohydrolase family protein [Pirellulales bacterium]|jgi:cytosine/adenosine deaminase-related metal-dependent hydrolase|nr:amidohydrolase family protein [Pirellulales bacterium]
MLALRAPYVFPVDRPPIRDGVVAIDHDRIVAVGESSSPAIRNFLPAARDMGRVAILPGLINAHTHLEFSDLQQPLGTPGMEFTQWIREVLRKRREEPSAHDAIERGIAESRSCGVTALGEIASTPWQSKISPSLEITEFCEVICFRHDADRQRYQAVTEAIGDVACEAESPIHWSEVLRPGISPHAPYTVRPEIVRECAVLSAKRRISLSIHLAESRDELMLLKTGKGAFVDLLQAFNAWDPTIISPASRPFDYLKILAKAHRSLVVHGNYLDDEEIEFLANNAHRMSVVYCPRTHAFFNHDAYPLSTMLIAGVNVALGTDSRASNPDLSIMEELRFAAGKHPHVDPANLLQMITVNAARALGRDQEIGTITLGKFADLAILSLPEHDAVDPHELLLESSSGIVATIFRGRGIHGEKFLMQR